MHYTTSVIYVACVLFSFAKNTNADVNSKTHLRLSDSVIFLRDRGIIDGYKPDLLKQVKKISTRFMNDEDFEYLVPLCSLKNVERLDFSSNRLTGAGLKIIADKCGTWDSVRSIILGGNLLVDEHLQALKAFPNLEYLNIDFHERNRKSAVDGSFLTRVSLPKLKVLEAAGIGLSDENALELLKLPALETFDLRRTNLSAQTFERLNSQKINIYQKPWDLRRIQFAAERAFYCPFNINEQRRAHYISIALCQGLITEEAVQFAGRNKLEVIPHIDPEYDGGGLVSVCRMSLEENRDEL